MRIKKFNLKTNKLTKTPLSHGENSIFNIRHSIFNIQETLLTPRCGEGNKFGKTILKYSIKDFRVEESPFPKGARGILAILVFTLLFSSCKDNYAPKPTAYPRIYYPAKKYKKFISEDCKYSFMHPEYAVVKIDKESSKTECFYNILYKPFNATLHITHHKINSRNSLDQLYNDTRKLTYKHTIKADDIVPIDFSIPEKNIHGIIYDIEGKTATNLNFFITDSTDNFIRGALYFNYRSNTDSVAPIFDFLKKDVDVFINNFEWED